MEPFATEIKKVKAKARRLMASVGIPTPPGNIDEQLYRAQTAWLAVMDNKKDAFGCIRLPQTKMLVEEKYFENCRLVPHREAILDRMKAGGIVAEVGVETGEFSGEILTRCKPEKLHLIDRDLHSFSLDDKFKSEIESGVVQLHEGDSSTLIAEFPDAYFDIIYIDADHTYQGVKLDIQASTSKIKEDGILIFNDYTYWSPVECMRYGVMQAVNELCLEENWELIYFALADYMYCDVAIKRVNP